MVHLSNLPYTNYHSKWKGICHSPLSKSNGWFVLSGLERMYTEGQSAWFIEDYNCQNRNWGYHQLKLFAVIMQQKSNQKPHQIFSTSFAICIVCKASYWLWWSRVFTEKTLTHRVKFMHVVEVQFFCLRDKHEFKQCKCPVNVENLAVTAPLTT